MKKLLIVLGICFIANPVLAYNTGYVYDTDQLYSSASLGTLDILGGYGIPAKQLGQQGGNTFLCYNSTTGYKVGQTFTISATSTINGFYYNIMKQGSPTNTVIFELTDVDVSNNPNTVLASTTMTSGSITTGKFQFINTPDVEVSPGMYGITAFCNATSSSNYYVMAKHTGSDQYTGGVAKYYNKDTLTWSNTNYDYVFAVSTIETGLSLTNPAYQIELFNMGTTTNILQSMEYGFIIWGAIIILLLSFYFTHKILHK